MEAKRFRKILGVDGFTLVELIVVITILVILGTIAFVNLGNFAGSARDGARIENLANLEKGLNLYQIKAGTYPMPENAVVLTASGTPIGYQGFARDQIAGIAKLSKGGIVDPSDANMYTTYSVNTNQTKMQLMNFLEDGSNVTAFVPVAFASASSDYSKRTPTLRGDTLGILLGNGTGGTLLNQPVQETLTGSLDILLSTGSYKAYLSVTTIISGTGNAFIPLLTNFDSTISTYPGCDTKDIKLPNGQIWAACNVGATTTYNAVNQSLILSNTWVTGWPTTEQKKYMGAYYQWGRNDDVTTGGTGAIATTGTLANTVGHSNFIPNWGGSQDWLLVPNDNLWWWQGTGTGAGTFVTQWYPSAMQWPCTTWYHIPTQLEWCNTISVITNNLFACDANWHNDIQLVQVLKLPLAGYRDFSTAIFGVQETYGHYWASSSNSNFIKISSSQIVPAKNSFRANGLSIRCLKN